jgi:hypothetical protein
MQHHRKRRLKGKRTKFSSGGWVEVGVKISAWLRLSRVQVAGFGDGGRFLRSDRLCS